MSSNNGVVQLSSMKPLPGHENNYRGGRGGKVSPNRESDIYENPDGSNIYENTAFRHDPNDPGTPTTGNEPNWTFKPKTEVITETSDPELFQQYEMEIQPHAVGGHMRGGLGDDDDEPKNCCLQKIENVQHGMGNFYSTHGTKIHKGIYALLIALYAAYFGYAMYYRFGDEGSVRLLWVTMVVVFFCIVKFISDNWGEKIYDKALEPAKNKLEDKWKYLRWVLGAIVAILVVVYLILDVAIPRPSNLVSGVGIITYVLLFFIFSFNPSKVRWRPVVSGLLLQFILALIILRTKWGFDAFEWIGSRVKEFLDHTDAGSKFVFGEKYTDHFFAFKVMPVVVFFSTMISILYYLGVMQVIIYKLSWIMQNTMGTTAAESMNAAGNIFVGQTEAPLLIRPLIQNMTRSELHAVMTGGFATIAGGVMATYIMIGVPANHLLSASVMSAPAALAMSKLFYPEVEESVTKSEDVANMEKSPQRNVIEAASAGASQSVKLVANIVANLIAFIALLTFINATLKWFGARVGIEPPDYPELTFELICSYVLWPFAFIMGIPVQDCRKVAELIGVKTIINEFVAYSTLGKLIENKKIIDGLATNATWEWTKWGDIYVPSTNTTLMGGILTPRATVITTYALCGFSNLSSIGIMLGGLGAMAPNKKSTMAEIALRAMIAGNVACFMTACISGLLYQGEL